MAIPQKKQISPVYDECKFRGRTEARSEKDQELFIFVKLRADLR